jgi:hypothetical protein
VLWWRRKAEKGGTKASRGREGRVPSTGQERRRGEKEENLGGQRRRRAWRRKDEVRNVEQQIDVDGEEKEEGDEIELVFGGLPSWLSHRHSGLRLSPFPTLSPFTFVESCRQYGSHLFAPHSWTLPKIPADAHFVVHIRRVFSRPMIATLVPPSGLLARFVPSWQR